VSEESRLDRIEQKLDKMAEAIVSLARMEERMTNLFSRMNSYEDRQHDIEERVYEVEKSSGTNNQTLRFIERIFWIIVSSGVATAFWIMRSGGNG